MELDEEGHPFNRTEGMLSSFFTKLYELYEKYVSDVYKCLVELLF